MQGSNFPTKSQLARRKDWRARPNTAKKRHHDPIRGVDVAHQKVDLIITKVDPSSLPPIPQRKRWQPIKPKE